MENKTSSLQYQYIYEINFCHAFHLFLSGHDYAVCHKILFLQNNRKDKTVTRKKKITFFLPIHHERELVFNI